MSESDPSESQSERELFFEALGKTEKKERSDFLDGACFNQPELQKRIEELLANHAEQDSFMQDDALDANLTTLEATPISEGTGTVIGRYKLLQKVGEGGMGVVCMAEQTEPVSRKVALKTFLLKLTHTPLNATASWSAVVLYRFVALPAWQLHPFPKARTNPTRKAPEDWRTPRPGGDS